MAVSIWVTPRVFQSVKEVFMVTLSWPVVYESELNLWRAVAEVELKYRKSKRVTSILEGKTQTDYDY